MRLVAITVALAAILLSAPARGQEFPSRPVTIVVPLSSGTTVDLLARIHGEAVSKTLHQRVAVVNDAGSGGIVATKRVAEATANGYTILMANSGHAINGVLNKTLPFDPLGDFAGIAMVGQTPALVVLSPALRARDLKGFVDLAKRNPGAIIYASAGIGTSSHLAGAYFASAAGIQMVHAPYKTGDEILSDLMAGRAHVSFVPAAFVLPLVRDGKLQVLAVGAAEPMTSPLKAATARSQGVDYVYSTWYGFLAPRHTPPQRLSALSAAFVKANQDPDVRAKMQALGIVPETKVQGAFDAYIRDEMRRLDPVLREIADRL